MAIGERVLYTTATIFFILFFVKWTSLVMAASGDYGAISISDQRLRHMATSLRSSRKATATVVALVSRFGSNRRRRGTRRGKP
jgi:hypothetical protein